MRSQASDDEHIVEQVVRGLALILLGGVVLGALTSILAIRLVEALLAPL
jgi:hypothetical protein